MGDHRVVPEGQSHLEVFSRCRVGVQGTGLVGRGPVPRRGFLGTAGQVELAGYRRRRRRTGAGRCAARCQSLHQDVGRARVQQATASQARAVGDDVTQRVVREVVGRPFRRPDEEPTGHRVLQSPHHLGVGATTHRAQQVRIHRRRDGGHGREDLTGHLGRGVDPRPDQPLHPRSGDLTRVRGEPRQRVFDHEHREPAGAQQDVVSDSLW